jgi:hypothetical protein
VQPTAVRPLELSVRRPDIRTRGGLREKASLNESGKNDATCSVVESPQPLCLYLSEDQAGHLEILTLYSPKQFLRRFRGRAQGGNVLDRVSQHELKKRKRRSRSEAYSLHPKPIECNDFRGRTQSESATQAGPRFNVKWWTPC